MHKSHRKFSMALVYALLGGASLSAQVPAVYDSEGPVLGDSAAKPPSTYTLKSDTQGCQFPLKADAQGERYTPLMPIDNLPWIHTLPDPLLMADGHRASTPEEWQHRRADIIRQLYHYEVGEKPPTPRDSIEAWMDADTLCVRVHGNGEALDIRAAIKYPEGEGPFPAIIGVGRGSGSLPPEIFESRGIAQISYWFPQVMSHTQKRGTEPINRIYPDREDIGAYSAWPWGVSRLIDGLEMVGDASRIDTRHLGVTGCSFAGKLALWSGALDQRIALTIAQEPGGGGAAAWRVSDGLGWVETLGRTNYSWFLEDMRQFSDYNVNRLPVDHHELVALVAPRALLVLGNTDYEWLADQSGYVSCRAAIPVWEMLGVPERMGYSIEGNHPHCMLPDTQRPEVEAFVDRYLLEKAVDTHVARAPMFESVDYEQWMPWNK